MLIFKIFAYKKDFFDLRLSVFLLANLFATLDLKQKSRFFLKKNEKIVIIIEFKR